MNLLGKIFVVALFVLSVVFMTLAMAVYATHRNWKEEADKARSALQQQQTANRTLQSQYNALEERLTAEAEAALQQVRKLETESARLAQENASTRLQLNELKGEAREAVASVKATQQVNGQLADEVTQLRESISDNIAQKDDAFDVALRATEELQSLRNDLETAVEYNRQLVGDAGRMTRLLESNNLDPEAPADGYTPKVDGVVSATQRRSGAQLVEISIGSDDGLRVGSTVKVFRGSRYKGVLQILKTEPDRSVGRVDTRYQSGPILEGDRVSTRLN
ncbi:MAG: hypothetical protein AAF805_07325 [Planctomycetota bacterium]